MKDKNGSKYVPIYLDWLEVTQDLTAEEKGNLIDAVVAYASELEYEHLLTGGVRIAFRFLKGQVDRNRELSAKRSKAASGEPDEATEGNEEQTGTNRNKPEQTDTKLPKEKEKEEDKEKEKDKNRFVAPTLEEVTAYMKEIGCDVDPQYFLDYQEARNWVLSNGKKAKDWKAVIRTWKHNDFKRTNSNSGVKTVVAQNYTQRDYDGEQEDALRRTIEQAKKGQAGVDYGYEDIILRRMVEDMKTG